MGDVETVNDVPQIKCVISDCGQLPDSGMDFFDSDDMLPHGPEDLTIIPEKIMVRKLEEKIWSLDCFSVNSLFGNRGKNY